MRQIKPHSQEVEPEARDTSPNRAAANGGLFRPMPGPPLAELSFEDAYRRVPMRGRAGALRRPSRDLGPRHADGARGARSQSPPRTPGASAFNTTDVRRHKLKLYEAWGFPELWVEVPDTSPRPAKTHGLTIYLLKDGALREAPISRAFPGWAANEIHRAFNEARISDRTSAILERVGAAMGAREGTGPDDDPLLRSQRQAGLAMGRQEALSEARAAELKRRAAMVRAIMADRHLDVTANFPLEVPGFAEANVEDVATAAMGCANEADFAALLRHARP